MEIQLDWSEIKSEEIFYDVFLPQVKAPEWHGRNLDALNDSLVTGDINQINPPYEIINCNVSRVPEDNRDFMRKVLKIFQESAIEHGGSKVVIS